MLLLLLLRRRLILRLASLPCAEQKKLSVALARLDIPGVEMFRGDPTAFERYTEEVPCPMYLDLVTTRLENCYYRTLAHIRHDIGLLLSNFKVYNKDEPFEWVAEVEEALLGCVDGATRRRTTPSQSFDHACMCCSRPRL